MADIVGARRHARRLVALAALVAVSVGAPASHAVGATGGAGLGGATGSGSHHRARHTHHVHHPPRHPARHRPPRRAPASPLDGRAMWIWELGDSSGGSVAAIAAAAHRYGVGTVLVKAGDGSEAWSQFSPALVSALHAAHVRVCAWQYVYGNHPGVEADVGAVAVRDGADCLIIDAETEYEGKYVAAQSYVADLRKQIGARFPVALAGFPYVDYHPAFPFSVFLGPGGAQYDMPQMYWRDIRVSVDAVYAHTYAFNLPYGRAILPLGQIYSRPPARQILRFRMLSKAYGAPGVSWWDWQEAGAREWSAVSRPTGRVPHFVADRAMAPVGRGAAGDLVVWIQEHLVAAGDPSAIDGDFGAGTRAAVRAFQAAHGLGADGIVGDATWRALLRYRPVRVRWVHHGRHTVASYVARGGGIGAGAADVRTAGPVTLAVPRSASRPARRDEIPGAIGAGRPR